MYIFTVYFYCISVNLSYYGAFYLCMFESILCTLFYALPFGVINDDDLCLFDSSGAGPERCRVNAAVLPTGSAAR